MIYLISGKARHGKDSLAEYLAAENTGRKTLILHLADYLKFICQQYFSWNLKKDEAGRSLLQLVGTDIIRKNNPDLWVNVLIGLIEGLGNQYDDYIIPDVRFPNEISLMQEAFPSVVSILVERLNEDGTPFDNGLTEEQKKHPSETALDYHHFDIKVRAKSGDMDLLKENARKILWVYA